MLNLLLAYGAGVLTLINPCVLPVLPIVLATSLQASPLGPVALAAGMSAAFVTLGITVTALGQSIGLTEDTVAQVAALMMMGFGLTLLIPRLNAGFATATAGLAARADQGIGHTRHSGLPGQVLGGMLLGAVWSPCVGPTLGGAISLASQGQDLGRATATMTAFALGVSTIILGLGYSARAALNRHKALLRAVAEQAKPVLGWVFLAVGLMILTGLHRRIEGWLLDVLPFSLTDFSVSI